MATISKYFCLWIIFSANLAWGEVYTDKVFDCAKDTCVTRQGKSKIFEASIFFYNVKKYNFANNGAMTFKNLVYFANNNQGTDFKNGATFANNGVMNFESSAVFQLLENINDGILNFNAGMGGDDLYAAVSGNIFNDGTINVNGQIGFSAAIGEEAYNWWQVIVNNESGTFNVNRKTKIEQVVHNVGSFYIYNDATFEQVLHNLNGGLFVIERPTIVTYWLNNQDGATLHIKGTTLTINTINDDGVFLAGQGTFWNFRGAILIFSAVNGRLGQLIGNFINYGNADGTSKDEGKIQINVRGLSAGTKYQIINGTHILLDRKDIEFINGTGQYLNNGWVLVNEVFALKTPIIATHRANVATMNNMFLASNAVMSAHHKNTKFRKMANRNNRFNLFSLRESEANKTIYFEKCLDCHELQSNSRNDGNLALDSLKSNESFFYNSQDLAKNSVNLTKNHSNLTTNLNAKSTDLANPNDNFFFLLTPFVNHTSFKAMGDYQISGLDYGFISAFGGKVSKNHTLGTHFALDYANLGDKNDKSVKITNLNLMAGLNYRADLIYAMYLKARGDFYYFLNSADSSEITTAKPNNLGFGLSVAFGKDFDFKQGGILGIELGLDYKAFHTSKVSANDIWGNASDEYKSAFYHLLYLDLGLNYYKYFSIDSGLWGIDAGFGIRGNLTPKVSNGTLMVANRAVDITLDNDNMLGYVSLGGSYVLEAQRFDMEFTLRYNGSFGDKSISNGGSFE